MPSGRTIARIAGLLLALVALGAPGHTWAQGHPRARDLALAHAGRLGLQRGAADLVVTDAYVSRHNGVTHVHLRQQVDGIAVANGRLNVNVAADGTVLSAGDRAVRSLAARGLTRQPVLGAEDAVRRAAKGLGLAVGGPLDERARAGGPTRAARFAGAGLSLDEIPVELAYYALETGEVRLTWEMRIRQVDQQHWWHLWVDAATGEIVAKVDWIAHDTYEVFEIPKESPSDGPRTVQANPADTTASPFGWHDTDGVAGAEFTVTRGNNVCAQEDRNADNSACGTGLQPDGGPGLDFQFAFDPNDQPVDYQEAAVTNLFYWNNVMHDVLYRYGFDEASGNFQENNYGKGGIAGDPVDADAQDGGGLNNANFGTPPDGDRPRMQMFEWVSGTVREVVVDPPSSGAGTYGASRALFGPELTETGVSGAIVLADDGSGTVTDGCEPFPAGFLTGALALIDRGICTFVTKVRHAQDAGAVGVIIANNVGGGTVTMGDDGTGGDITIPSLMVGLGDGSTIRTGLPATGTLRLTPAAPPARDSDLDNGIIAHEYCHGLSIRLTGGAGTSSCLSGAQQPGEGWSDFCALFVSAAASDTATTPRGVGTYVVFQGPTGTGLRPFPYTTDLGANPLTYGDLVNAGLPGGLSIPHGVGTVWATALWDMYWSLVDAHGFDADLYTGTGGNNLAMQLVVDGLKLQPCNPSFLDARDAILLADTVNNAGANQCAIWLAFAGRGMGVGADDGGSASSLAVTEAFDVPPACLPACGDAFCDGPIGENCTTCPADCDDGDVCTVCESGVEVECSACELCDPIEGCIAAPQASCKVPAVPLKALLQIKDRTPDNRDRLTWKWLKGEATDPADFGDPLTTDDYVVCVYDQSGPEPSLVMRATAPAAGECRGKPCWKLRRDRLTYRDRDLTPDGLSSIVPRAGAESKAKIIIKGKGENLSVPTLPLGLPALVQLQVGNGECWEAQYLPAGVRRNDAIEFKGKAGM